MLVGIDRSKLKDTYMLIVFELYGENAKNGEMCDQLRRCYLQIPTYLELPTRIALAASLKMTLIFLRSSAETLNTLTIGSTAETGDCQSWYRLSKMLPAYLLIVLNLPTPAHCSSILLSHTDHINL
jgi:hypothetical protein